MGKFVTAIIGVVEIAVGVLVPGMQWLIPIGVGTLISGVANVLLAPGSGQAEERMAQGTQVQVGEVERQGMVGDATTAGSLVDAFNYGGTYGTDWTVLTIALADHKSDSLVGFYVNNDYVAFAGDGTVSGYNGQLAVYFRDGSWDQSPPSILTTNAPYYPSGHPLAGTRTWTSDDRGRGVSYVVVAYKADDPKSQSPVWTAGRPTFTWRLKGLLVYSAREDDTVGGSGDHRWTDDSTRVWSNNLIDVRYTWVRGIYVEGHVDEPKYLLLGRGLTAEEAPPENQFAPANLCDEDVSLAAGGTEKRYTANGLISAGDAYITTETDFAAACGGTILDRAGSVELAPGAAETPAFAITDADLVQGTKVTARDFRSKTDQSWVNMVSAVYIEPAQKWSSHAAPLHRDDDDVTADGEPRLGQPQLKLVTSGTQAQRVAEMVRRKGRLWRTRGLTLPPRLAGVEHGDWITWTSQRYGPKGAPGTPLTFRVVSDGQGQDWRNTLTLEQISSAVYDWDHATDELGENGQAIDNPAIDPIATTVYATMGVLTLVSKTVNYPLSSDDDSISVEAFTGITNNGLSIDFPADTTTLASLDPGTTYAVFWDMANEVYACEAYPATTSIASSGFVLIGIQSTSDGGVYPDTDTAPPGTCVTDDTPILLSDGSEVPASELAIGTVIRTRHERTMAWGDYTVAAISFHERPIYACELEGLNGAVTIRATALHRFLVNNRWVFAKDLGEPAGTGTVAKITVAEAHTYISAGVVSHNAKPAGF